MHTALSTIRPAPPGAGPETSGIYVHVPFCLAKCRYCDFYSITDLNRIPGYLDALVAEIDPFKQVALDVDSIYFGGGTPSALTPAQIVRILTRLFDCFSVHAGTEITLEVNPGTVSPDKLAGYRAAGINRLNIGIQSLDDRHLRLLGRIHTVRQGTDTLKWAGRSGFDNVGIDLIYGLPGQRQDPWATELAAAAGLDVQHMACYLLTLEPDTPLSRMIESGKLPPPDDAVTGDLFSFTADFLNRHGYRQYEVSNFARRSDRDATDYRSRHNRKYWRLDPYLGFGPAAHSYMGDRRWWNVGALGEYVAAIGDGRSPVAQVEVLNREQRIMEAIYLGLRQTAGIDLADFRRRFDADLRQRRQAEVSRLLDEGLIEIDSRRIRTTPLGMRFLDQVVQRLIG